MESYPVLGNDGPVRSADAHRISGAVADQFGSVDAFKEAFVAAGVGQFGSGWCWLVQQTDGSLAITKTEMASIRYVLVRQLF